MKVFSNKGFSYILLLLLVFIRILFFFLDFTIPILDLLVFGIFFLIFLFLYFKKEMIRNYQKSFTQTVLIISIGYYIIYYFLGLIVGFVYNTYNTTFTGILYNSFIIIIPLLLREEIRRRFIQLHRNSKAYILVTIIFICYELMGSTFFSYQNNEELLSKVFIVFIPIILENIILTYLAFIGERKTVYAYLIPSVIAKYMVPINTDLDWFYQLLLQIIFYIIIYTTISNEYSFRIERRSPKSHKKYNFVYYSLFVLVVVFGLFVAGVFKYQPVAILTYSMKPTFTRGDAVVIQKLTDDEKQNLKKGDVIQYQYNKIVVIHRIVDVYKVDGEKVFVLKGDNNQSNDSSVVYTKQIMGKAIFSIPKVGYPSVWLSEFLYPDREVEVETGR